MKRYDQVFIEKKRQDVGNIERNVLLQNKPVQERQELPLALIMDYNLQHKQVERIIEKYWNILKYDDILKSFILVKPRFIYKRATILRDQLVKNVVEPPVTNTIIIFDGKCFYACGRCYSCRAATSNTKKRDKFTNSQNGKEYTLRDFVLCNTEGVVYAHVV